MCTHHVRMGLCSPFSFLPLSAALCAPVRQALGWGAPEAGAMPSLLSGHTGRGGGRDKHEPRTQLGHLGWLPGAETSDRVAGGEGLAR